MRSELSLVLALLVGCSPGNRANFTLKGQLAGKPIDMGFALTSGGGAVNDGTNFGGTRNTADQLAVIGGLNDYSVARGSVCPTDPCPTAAELILWTPPAIIHAGPWTLPFGSELNLSQDTTPLAKGELASTWALEFDEPEFSPAGRLTMRNTAKFIRGPVETPESRALELEGSVGLEYQCHLQSKYFRHCGQAIAGDGQQNPLNLPYARASCPAELVAPYEASPTWRGNTLQLGELSIDCRETEGSLHDGKKPVLCYSKRTGVVANGCTWTLHFLTDGALYQFALAGFADASCPTRWCNTYR